MKFDSVAKVRCDYAIETFQKTNGFQSQRKTCGCPLFRGEKKSKKILRLNTEAFNRII